MKLNDRKIGYISNKKFKSFSPFIRIQGKYLTPFGFKIGGSYDMIISRNKIILRAKKNEKG